LTARRYAGPPTEAGNSFTASAPARQARRISVGGEGAGQSLDRPTRGQVKSTQVTPASTSTSPPARSGRRGPTARQRSRRPRSPPLPMPVTPTVASCLYIHPRPPQATLGLRPASLTTRGPHMAVPLRADRWLWPAGGPAAVGGGARRPQDDAAGAYKIAASVRERYVPPPRGSPSRAS
jgi:hypothetical protein